MSSGHTHGRMARMLLLGCCVAIAEPSAAQVCGDGVAQPPEECDDGNTTTGDGCSGICELENATALCAGVPASSGDALATVLVASGLSSPVQVTAPPLDPNRIFVLEKTGAVRVILDGTLLPAPFLTLAGRVSTGPEQGLLSLAFHPNYKVNRRLFVSYTDTAGNLVIGRYEASAINPNVMQPGSERIVLAIAQPFPDDNGGQLAFGPGGRLYVGVGDGGGIGDPLETGQSNTTLLGKILRLNIDVEIPPFYSVPLDNPNPGAGIPLGLIWAKGLHNPWRFSFDRATNDLYVGDVGESQREEIDVTLAPSSGGQNYGWDVLEGSLCFDPPPLFPSCPAPGGFVLPVHEYDHSQGCAVIGGFVYRGCALPDLHGTYFYGDYCSAFVHTFELSGGVAVNHADRTAELTAGGASIDSITSFGADARGELYVADQDGDVFQIVPAPPTATPTETPTSTFTWTPLPTDTPTATATDTETPTASFTDTPTVTETASETPTASATATETATAVPTDTAPPPPATATPSDTPAPPATATSTFVEVTPTGVVVEPTATATSTRTRTKTPTRTPIPPTATPTMNRPCRGDVDGDGHVGANDVFLVANALFSTPGRPRWNPAADLNHNGIVDPVDLLIVIDGFLDPRCR